MKNVRLALTLAAFTIAIAAAAMTSRKLEGVTAYGYNPETGQCVPGELLQEGCSVNGLYTCTIWLEEVGPVPAYKFQLSTNTCATAYKRWDF